MSFWELALSIAIGITLAYAILIFISHVVMTIYVWFQNRKLKAGQTMERAITKKEMGE